MEVTNLFKEYEELKARLADFSWKLDLDNTFKVSKNGVIIYLENLIELSIFLTGVRAEYNATLKAEARKE